MLHAFRNARHHLPSLVASLLPGALFAGSLPMVASDPRFSFAVDPARWPLELWVVAVAGTLATAAGVADWIYHRTAEVRIGPNERRSELVALAFGGFPTFLLLATATFAATPAPWLLPILVTLTFTIVAICYDEFVFHRRRCTPTETALHRALTLGHGVAFLAWMHFVFVTRPS